MFKRIDHVVIAVKDLEETASLYTKTYGLKQTEPEEIPALGIRRVNIDVGNAYIELAQPTDPNGPIAKFLADRGEGLYLIAVTVDDLPGAVKQLQERGARLIGAENASKPAGGQVFIHPKSAHGALIMLSQ
ncbi:MAG: VOC family protein [Dehalococcoidia bacterium]